MITLSSNDLQRLTWQKLLREGAATVKELLAILELDAHLLPDAALAAKIFPLRVPRGFVARMEKGNINDPLLKQVLPITAELLPTPGFSTDPLGEKSTNPLPGLLHKYQGRVLLTVSGGCAVHCRYCFRRHFPYAENNPGRAGWRKALDYISADPSITEVIFSGGDPLSADDDYLAALTQQIADIRHVKTLRIHTRMPIVLPERITPEFLNWFTGSRLLPVLVTHCNHANEIDGTVINAMRTLKNAGITLLNQTVLLRDINDSADVLIKLSEQLFAAGVLPYYLHVLDKVQGAAHFEVTEMRAKQLIQEITARLPGYLVPKLVREVAGAASKIAV